MNELPPQRLIVCAGIRVQPACAQAMEDFRQDQPLGVCRFIMSDWLDDDQHYEATLLWVVDESEPWEAVHFAMSNRIPLLVPEDNEPMKQVCLSAGCGMFYRDAPEARTSLEFLLTNEAVRRQLGANGQAYIRQLSKASVR
jgi:hypothetical protein